MSTLQIRTGAVTTLAQRVAELLPDPPSAVVAARDPELDREWELIALSVAGGLARAVDHDADVLRHAVGPALEVGTNPRWRVLLELALLRAQARADGRPIGDAVGAAVRHLPVRSRPSA